MTNKMRTALLATTALGFLLSGPAHAADTSTADAIKALQAQVNALQKQLGDMQTKEATRAAAEAAKPAAAAPAAPATTTAEAGKKEILPGVTVKLGGYIAAEGVYRDHNQTTDINSSINGGIPYANSRNANMDEFRLSARASRLSLLAQGKASETMDLSAYVETDFMGSATTSNSVQTNSYAPRLRQAFAQIDKSDWGMHFVGGQAFSLATLYKSGLTSRQEAGVMTIDAVGAPGYVYTRTPGVRMIKDFANNKAHFGLSLEEPEANLSGLPCTANAATGICTGFSTTTSATTPGTSPLNTGVNYSMDYAPDVIAKLAYDSSVGHFEIFGMTRFFRDQAGTNYHNNYAMGFGGGVGAFIPVIPKKLEVQANVMGGRGVGRYSAAQIPDFAFTPSGDIKPVTQFVGLVGLLGHPTTSLDVYLYAGAEKALRQDYSNTAYGYGASSLNLSGCYNQGGTCNAQTETVWQISPGFWQTVYKGDYGNMKLGAQYSFTRKDSFSGANNQSPHAYENVVMTSFRYSPF